jgi:signal transduction histidine kinase
MAEETQIQSRQKDSLCLLLVDDEDDFRQAVARRLDKRGITSEQAADGEQCLKILESTEMDVVVLDIKMPGINGIDVLRIIKKKYPSTEVILLTGHATTQDGVEGIKAGAFDYLTKPVEFEQLLSKIRHAHDKILREEEKRKQAEFRAQMEQQMIATERLASLGTLATGVAHEINNPLAIIKESAGYLGALLKKPEFSEMPLKPSFQLALEKIEKSIDRARKITHQLLGSVRNADAVRSEIDLKELAIEAVQLIGREAVAKEIDIQVNTGSSLDPIWSDPYQLRQVFINLLNNAVYATPPNGKIGIDLATDSETATLSFKDTGVGIPKENLKRIFEPFFSTKPPGQGTGLGLFVTKGIVEKLGGNIRVESRVGEGTEITLMLPKSNGPEIQS